MHTTFFAQRRSDLHAALQARAATRRHNRRIAALLAFSVALLAVSLAVAIFTGNASLIAF